MASCKDCLHAEVCLARKEVTKPCYFFAVSEAKWALENLIPPDKRDEYRIISNEPEKEREETYAE